MSHWSEISANHDERDTTIRTRGVEDDILSCIAVDAWRGDDENEEGNVIARVVLTRSGDVGVIYCDAIAITDEYAQEVIAECVLELRQKAAKKNKVAGIGVKPLALPSINLDITNEDIDNIMCAALEGGITYWCGRAEVVGEYLGEFAHEQIGYGGDLILYDAESSDKWTLTLDMVLRGIKDWVVNGVKNGWNVYLTNIDGHGADMIVQYALFGEIVFG